MSLGRGMPGRGRQRLPVQRHRHAAGPAIGFGPGGRRMIVVERGDVLLALAIARGMLTEDDARGRAAAPARSSSPQWPASPRSACRSGRAATRRGRRGRGFDRRRPAAGGGGGGGGGRRRMRPRRGGAGAAMCRGGCAGGAALTRRRCVDRRGGGRRAAAAVGGMQVLGDAAPVTGRGRAAQEADDVHRAGDRRLGPPCRRPSDARATHPRSPARRHGTSSPWGCGTARRRPSPSPAPVSGSSV